MQDPSIVVELTAEIVAACASANALQAEEVPLLIKAVHGALAEMAAKGDGLLVEPPTPAVPIKKSVTPDHLFCLEDGKKLKTLKRYLKAKFSMTPAEYRAKWGLPRDYPMVAPNYAKQRSELARRTGLGRTKPAKRQTRTTDVE